MHRLFLFVGSVAAALALVAPTSAARTGGGVIFFEVFSIGCGITATNPDGSFWFTAGVPESTLVGGETLADDRVGWVCTGSVAEQLLPIATPLVLTGLTCRVSNPAPTVIPIRPGTLTSSGTAIFYPDGTARLICPPSERA